MFIGLCIIVHNIGFNIFAFGMLFCRQKIAFVHVILVDFAIFPINMATQRCKSWKNDEGEIFVVEEGKQFHKNKNMFHTS
jgi:hypothetical protein